MHSLHVYLLNQLELGVIICFTSRYASHDYWITIAWDKNPCHARTISISHPSLLLYSTKDKTMMPSPLIKQVFSSEVPPSRCRDAFQDTIEMLSSLNTGEVAPIKVGARLPSRWRDASESVPDALQFPNIQTLRACFEGKENYSAFTPPCNYHARTSLHAIKHSWLLQTLLAIKHSELGKHC